MQRTRRIKASQLAVIAAGGVVWFFAATTPAAPPITRMQGGDSVARLVERVTGRAVISVREEAAAQLVGLNTPDANLQIDGILKNFDNPRAQAAIAKALARTINPNPVFIRDLQNLLGPEAAMTDAAARALAQYDSSPEAIDAIKKFIDNAGNPTNVRTVAIRALGQIVQQPVAGYLINLIAAPSQSSPITNAATDALGEMTGITAFGNNPGQWQQWWNSARGKAPAEFQADILESRFKLLKQENDNLVKDAGDQLKNNFDVVLGLKKEAAAAMLRGYLDDRVPEIRIAGVELAREEYTNLDQPLRSKLLSMIDDPDDHVRLAVASALLVVLNDRAGVAAVLDQLNSEKKPQIRIKLIQVLGKLEDLAAAPALIALLHDHQPEIVNAAAKALAGNLGTQLRKANPRQADQASADLRNIVATNTGPGSDELRAACVAALAALRDPISYELFRRLVQPGETSEVRQAALRGLGNLANPNADETVANQLNDNDRKVRLEGATALQTVATPSYADFIFRNLKHNPAPDDPDKDISDALWIAMVNLFPRETPADLDRWADSLRDAPDKRLVVLQKLGDMLDRQNDVKGVAENRQVIADAMRDVKPPRYTEAIDNLEQALKYWRGPGNGDRDKEEAIIGALLEDELEAGEWEKATDFAAEQIRLDPVYSHTVGPKLTNRADELVNGDPTRNITPNPTAAKTLIDEAIKIPRLDDKYVKQLGQLADELKEKRAD